MATVTDPNAPQTAPGGLVSNAQAAPAPAPAPPVTGYAPTTVANPSQWNIDNQQTVAGQVNSLTQQDSPLMQQARTGALQQMNDRGLVNSSMAIGAADQAAYNAAIPIAQADATAYQKSAAYNVDQQNQTNLQNAQIKKQASQFNSGETNKQVLQTQDEANRLQLQTLQNNNQLQLQDMQNKNQLLLNTNSQAGSLFQQATAALNNIAVSDKLDPATKTEQSRQVMENLKSQLDVISATANLNLGSILGANPYPVSASAQSGLTAQQLKDMYSYYQQQQQTTPASSSWAVGS